MTFKRKILGCVSAVSLLIAAAQIVLPYKDINASLAMPMTLGILASSGGGVPATFTFTHTEINTGSGTI